MSTRKGSGTGARKPAGSGPRAVRKAKPAEHAALAAFEAAAHEIPLPADAHVIGEPVIVTQIHNTWLPRVGLLATCERGGRAYEVSLADVVFPSGSGGRGFVERYRSWLGVDVVAALARPHEPARPHKIARDDVTVGVPVELVVLAWKSNALRCRLLGTTREVTLRTARGPVRDEVPGSIITVTPTRHWTHARHPYVAGEVSAVRVDAAALGLVPLALRDEGEWNPEDEYWGEEGEPIDEWARPIIARGRRPRFEMEQVIPGADPDDFDSDPIVEASERRFVGDLAGAHEILMSLLAQDLRCLDAHAHLGNFAFDRWPRQALRHYEVGRAIGELSLGDGFEGVLPWGLVDNRPYLRCLHGAALCAWRLGDQRRAASIFEKMLWLNPGDNQGARFNLAALAAGKAWEEVSNDDG